MCSDETKTTIAALDRNRKRNDLYYFGIIVIAYAIILTLIAGVCFSAPPDEVAVDLAVATMVEGVEPKPNPSPFDCATCKDTGWIMHGDGHQTKCPNCYLAKIPTCRKGILEYAAKLAARGQALILQSKQVLTAADRKGKVVDELVAAPAGARCVDGKCSVTQQYRQPTTKKRTVSSWRWKR